MAILRYLLLWFFSPLLAEASPSSPSKQTKKSRKRQADNATFASSKQARTEEPNPRQDHVQDNQLVGPQETWNEDEVGLIRGSEFLSKNLMKGGSHIFFKVEPFLTVTILRLFFFFML